MSGERRRSTTELPPQVLMPLLDYVTAHSMDEDYEHVAARSGDAPKASKVRPGAAALLILGLFGVLVATAGVQTSRNADESAGGRESLIQQIEARSGQLESRRERVASLRAEVDTLQTEFLETTTQGRALSGRLDRLGVMTGVEAVTGPGVKVVVDDAENAVDDKGRVFDTDLQKLANALWASGAEAISINGQRLTNLSAIRFAASAITVNFTSLSPPYTVLAVGNPDTMPARFVETKHGQDWLDLQATFGLRLAMTTEESLSLPAAPTRHLNLRHATQGDTP